MSCSAPQVSATTSTYSGGTASSNSLSLGDGRPTRTASSSVPSTTGLSISDRSVTHSSGQEVQLLVAEMQGLHKLLTTLLQVRCVPSPATTGLAVVAMQHSILR